MSKNWNDKSSDAWDAAWDAKNIGSSIGSLGTGMLGIFNAGKSNAEVESIEDEKALARSVGETQFSSGSYDNLLEQFDIRNTARTNYTGKELRGLNGWQMAGNTFSGVLSGASAGASVGGPWGAVAGGLVGLGSGLGGIFTGNAKARNNAEELNYLGRRNNTQLYANYGNAVSNTHDMKFNKSILNMSNSAYGGPLFNHSENFDNGVIFINEGGTHEQNPLGGVPVGIDQEGTPNLIEEGEVIWNDYVFSNRLKPTKKQLENAGYGDKYQDLTFAKMIEKIQDSERPNDTISQDSLNDFMSDLIVMQEEVRAKKVKREVNKFSEGGNILANGDYLKYDNSQGFKYYKDGIYHPGYLNWLNTLSLEKDKDVLTELNAYYNTTLNKDIQVDESFLDLTKRLGQDKKFGEFHRKLGDIYPRTLLSNEDLKNNDFFTDKGNKTLTDPFTFKNDDKISLKKDKKNKYYLSSNYLADPITYKNDNEENDEENNGEYGIKDNLLRYASPLINFGTFLSNLKQPDYSNADRIDKAAQQIPGGSFTPLGDYINLEPLDRNYYLNPLLATSRSNARNIQNQGLNAGQTIAGLLANNYNTQRNIGTTLMQMDQENMNRRLQEATFNRGTNQANAQMGLQALAMDQQRANNILNATAQSSAMRNSLDAMRSQALSTSLTGIADDLGSISRENMDRQMLMYLADKGVIKTANGGFLTRRKRRIK